MSDCASVLHTGNSLKARLDGFGPVRTQALTVADDGSRWRGPGENHGFDAVVQNGSAPRSLAADAHHCIMVGSLHPPNTRMWHEYSCTTRGLPSGSSSDHSKSAVVLEPVKDRLAGGLKQPILDRSCARRLPRSGVGRGEEMGLPGRTRKYWKSMQMEKRGPLTKNSPYKVFGCPCMGLISSD